MNEKLDVNGNEVRVRDEKGVTWFSITDIAKTKSSAGEANDVIRTWMRATPTIQFLGLWESLNNHDDFKPHIYDGFKKSAGENSFQMSPTKWINGVGAIGLKVKAGRYGGTWARRQIALEFASWVDPSFKLYLIREFERLKELETGKLDWHIKRQIASDNHHLHTDSIRRNLVPPAQVNKKGERIFQANEVDMLNDIVFGMTAKEWRIINHDKPKSKNMRDYATKEELFLLNNLQAINTAYLKDGLDQVERYHRLKGICDYQKRLIKTKGLKVLP